MVITLREYYYINDTNGFLYENGVLVNSNLSLTTSGNTSATDSVYALLGSATASYFNGHLAEVLVYTGAHNSTQVAQTHAWLNNFYGL